MWNGFTFCSSLFAHHAKASASASNQVGIHIKFEYRCTGSKSEYSEQRDAKNEHTHTHIKWQWQREKNKIQFKFETFVLNRVVGTRVGVSGHEITKKQSKKKDKFSVLGFSFFFVYIPKRPWIIELQFFFAREFIFKIFLPIWTGFYTVNQWYL